jgi:hypothetical protein
MLADARRHDQVVSANLAGTVMNSLAKHNELVTMDGAFDLIAKVRYTDYRRPDNPAATDPTMKEISNLIAQVDALIAEENG